MFWWPSECWGLDFNLKLKVETQKVSDTSGPEIQVAFGEHHPAWSDQIQPISNTSVCVCVHVMCVCVSGTQALCPQSTDVAVES